MPSSLTGSIVASFLIATSMQHVHALGEKFLPNVASTQCNSTVANSVLRETFAKELTSTPILAELFADPNSAVVRAAINDCRAGREGGGRQGMQAWIQIPQNRRWYWDNLISQPLASLKDAKLKSQCNSNVANSVLRQTFSSEVVSTPILANLFADPNSAVVRAAINDCRAGREGGGRQGMQAWIQIPQNRRWYWDNLIAQPLATLKASTSRNQVDTPTRAEPIRPQVGSSSSMSFISSSSGYLLHYDSNNRAVTKTWAGQSPIEGFNGYGKIRIDNKCLTGPREGQLYWTRCNIANKKSQVWSLKNKRLINELGWCADVKDGKDGAGVAVVAWECTGSTNQQWKSHSARAGSNTSGISSNNNSEIKQAIYFIDGTNSAFTQNNLLHQMSQWVRPNGGKSMIRYVAGIDTWRGDGIDDVYRLALWQIRNDLSQGIKQFYIFGYSRGAFVALNLSGNLCGLNGNQEYDSKICNGIKAVVLLDPVRSTIPGWRDYQANQLINKTLFIGKNGSVFGNKGKELVLTTHFATNIGTRYLVDALHSEIICGNPSYNRNSFTGPIQYVEEQVIAFTKSRGLLWSPQPRKSCVTSEGAWPPCIAVDGKIVQCSRTEVLRNWQGFDR